MVRNRIPGKTIFNLCHISCYVNFVLQNSRGLAQYLKDYSPCTTIPEQPAEDFSLNKILDGKTRKIAARMFFEVLVSHDISKLKIILNCFTSTTNHSSPTQQLTA